MAAPEQDAAEAAHSRCCGTNRRLESEAVNFPDEKLPQLLAVVRATAEWLMPSVATHANAAVCDELGSSREVPDYMRRLRRALAREARDIRRRLRRVVAREVRRIARSPSSRS
jgi:hypothetical protein